MAMSSLQSSTRIIWAIAAKDIREAITSRTTLAVMLGVAVLVMSSTALPLLTSLNAAPAAVVHDPGRSALIRALVVRDDLRIGFVKSEEELRAAVGGSSEVVLGLEIPEGFAEAAAAGGSVDIAGSVPHWADAEAVSQVVAFYEQLLTEASWQTVSIDMAGREAYPQRSAPGYASMVVSGFVTALITTGLALVPHLLIEERETHTFDVLMVSPARYYQIVAGKALAGIFYGLCAGSVILLINARWIVTWWVAIVAVLLGTAFAVSLGLLLGVLFRSTSAMAAWLGLLLTGLLLPVMVSSFADDVLTGWLGTIVRWLPSVGLVELFLGALVRSPGEADIGAGAALLGCATLVIFVLVVVRIRREGNR